MIQRIQTIWLLLVALFSSLLMFCPVAAKVNFGLASVSYDSYLAIGSGLIAICAVIAIFLYKNRSLQVKMCYGILVLLALSYTIVFFDLYPVYLSKEAYMVFKFPIVFPLIAFVFDLLAIRAIWKDEKLVRSLDRLR